MGAYMAGVNGETLLQLLLEGLRRGQRSRISAEGAGEISICSCAGLIREPLPCRQATACLMPCWLRIHHTETCLLASH